MRRDLRTLDLINRRATIRVGPREENFDVRILLPAGFQEIRVAEPGHYPETFEVVSCGQGIDHGRSPGTFLNLNQLRFQVGGPTGEYLVFEGVRNPTEQEHVIVLESVPLATTATNNDPETGAVEGYEPPKPGGWDEYPLDELAIRDERRAAEDVVRRIEKGRFVLDPDFQREFVWNDEKQSRLIESILMRIPLPVFYVAEDNQGRLVVVDGRQRLTTLKRFLRNELKLDLEDRQELHGKTFDRLDVRLQNRVEDCQLLFYIIDHAVPERARLDIFERVNGGEVLTRQQMRNAIYNGPGTVFLKEEASGDLFRKATGNSLDAKKMQDREFVNRFCAFALLELETYKGDMDDWLARGLMRLSKLADGERTALRERMHRGLRNNLAAFGKHAFRKHRSPDQSRSIINASLFDVMMARLSDVDETLVATRADTLRQAFYKRLDDPRFNRAITYGPNTPKEVRTRFEICTEMTKEVFSAH